MKRTIISLGSLTSFLTLTSPAYAIDFCPFGQFGKLCELNPNDNTSLVSNVMTILLVVAVILALGFLIWGGIRWILAAGDKGKIDAARGTITGAIVGLVIAFLSFFIISFVNFFFGIDSKNGTTFQVPTLFQNKNPGRGDLPLCSTSVCSGKVDTALEDCLATNQFKTCR